MILERSGRWGVEMIDVGESVSPELMFFLMKADFQPCHFEGPHKLMTPSPYVIYLLQNPDEWGSQVYAYSNLKEARIGIIEKACDSPVIAEIYGGGSRHSLPRYVKLIQLHDSEGKKPKLFIQEMVTIGIFPILDKITPAAHKCHAKELDPAHECDPENYFVCSVCGFEYCQAFGCGDHVFDWCDNCYQEHVAMVEDWEQKTLRSNI